MVGANWSLNPWQLWYRVPLTYLGEVDFVELTPTQRSRDIHQLVAFHELDWRFFPGAQLRLRYDFSDPDLEVDDDATHRLNLGVDLFPYRYVELQTIARLAMPELGSALADFMLILRSWY